ncbi:hypothetical protein LRP50_00035 [Enterovibrio sp. ZSDZ42]|uniref:Uncharacterized protein n=1 Tax=Enterovibrio gelatinilyticus TaxID=2899819 RepID=A0ABT5QUT4_9GAMM|nr:hypothetical protein [Enterovibrio sp. ZSDZ42]MDD1791519.1 hypothetical protein [Enterovibrio sp. ZSDZ42]
MISPTSVHATSLCLDILSSEHFRNASQEDISGYYQEILDMVQARLMDGSTKAFGGDKHTAEDIAQKVVALLQKCKTSNYPTVDMILEWFESGSSLPNSN